MVIMILKETGEKGGREGCKIKRKMLKHREEKGGKKRR